jgi:Flp pilus assembly protein TadD
MCWIIKRDYENALKMFTKAAGIMPENVKYRANMAVALGLMGRDDESLSLFYQVLPEDQAKYNLSILQEARSSEKPTSNTISQIRHLPEEAK